MPSNSTITAINSARQRYSDDHPEKPRAQLTRMSEYQRARCEEFAYLATNVSRLYANKGVDFETLKSTCLEAIVKCCIKMDSKPYAYSLMFSVCKDACIDMLRACYRERKHLESPDEPPEEAGGEEDILLVNLLADAPSGFRQFILDSMHLTPAEVRVKHGLGDREYRRKSAEVKAYCHQYLEISNEDHF